MRCRLLCKRALRACSASPCACWVHPSVDRPSAPPVPFHFSGAVELRNAVATRFSVDLPATVTFDHPTPAALAAFVHAQLPQPAEAAAEQEGSSFDSWAAGPAAGSSRRRRRAAGGRGGRKPAGNSVSKQEHAAAVLAQLSEVVTGVLGSAVPPEQPLMEVRHGTQDSVGGQPAEGLRPAMLSCLCSDLHSLAFSCPPFLGLTAGWSKFTGRSGAAQRGQLSL